jgi:hypothetical protein
MSSDNAGSGALTVQIPVGSPASEERTTFTVRIAATDEDLCKAVQVRHAAYARHLPDLADRLRDPEPFDYDQTSVVLLAESKLDEAALGTMRIQSNLARPLVIEQSVALPAWLRKGRLAEATRLGVSQGRTGGVVKMMLFKAFYHYCLRAGVDWMVIGARPPLDRRYAALLFRDILPDARLVPLRHAGNVPHRILAFEVGTAETRWAEAGHPLFGFFCRTRHPDIDVRDVRCDFQRAAPAPSSLGA